MNWLSSLDSPNLWLTNFIPTITETNAEKLPTALWRQPCQRCRNTWSFSWCGSSPFTQRPELFWRRTTSLSISQQKASTWAASTAATRQQQTALMICAESSTTPGQWREATTMPRSIATSRKETGAILTVTTNSGLIRIAFRSTYFDIFKAAFISPTSNQFFYLFYK